MISFDTDYIRVDETAWSDPTYHRFIPNIQRTSVPESYVSDMFTAISGEDKRFDFDTHYAGANPHPLTLGLSPTIDVFGDFTLIENRAKQTLKITGQLAGDNFPSTEAFITDPSSQAVFLGIGYYQGSPYTSLPGENRNRQIVDFNLTLFTDTQGNFTSVWFNNQDYSINEWNQQFEQADPLSGGQ